MKKLLAILLAVAMLCTLSVSIFAADRVVGDPDGVSSITDGSHTTNLQISASVGSIQHKYAIDIEYSAMSIEVAGNVLTWDVNNLVYVSEGATTLTDKEFEVKVYNRSDMPIWYKAIVTRENADDGVNYGVFHATSDATIETTGVEMEKATPGNMPLDSFKITVASTDWETVSEYYAGKLSAASTPTVRMATVSISFDDEEFDS